MRRSTISFWLVSIGAAVGPFVCAQHAPTDFSDRAEVARLHQVTESLRLSIPADAEMRSEGNFIGFRTSEYLFSRRTDSRTYFVQHLAARGEKKAEVSEVSENELRGRLRETFKALEVPLDELAEEKILQEELREGKVDPKTKRIAMEPIHPGARWATASRVVEGVPVFSSRVMLRVGPGGRIDFLELHWPRIPPDVLAEAHRLSYKLKSGWKAPELEGVRVESTEVGIIHSPAVGFVMDFYPAIRVIYSHSEKDLGKKAVKYLDRNGNEIPSPRQFASPVAIADQKQQTRAPKRP